jgi:hypothetical protein
MSRAFVSGKPLQILGLPEATRLHAKRSLAALKKSGTIPDDEMDVLDRFVALSAKSGSKRVVDVAAIAAVRADRTQVKAFKPTELALLSRTMKRLEFIEPERAEPLPPLPPLRSEVVDASRLPAAAINTRVAINEGEFPREHLKALRRLQRVHDDDGDAGTVSLADLKAGQKDTLVFTDAERKVFAATRRQIEDRWQASTGTSAAVVVPQPGVRSYLIPCTAPELTLRLDTTVTLQGWEQTITAERRGAMHVDLPAGRVVTFIHEESGQEVVATKSGAIHLPEGSYVVEVTGAGERSVGHTMVPPSADATLDLTRFAGFTFLTDDHQPLVPELYDLLGQRQLEFLPYPHEAVVEWRQANETDDIDRAGFPPAVARQLGLSELPLPPGRYRPVSLDLELLVLSPYVMVAELTIDGEVHRAHLTHAFDRFDCDVFDPSADTQDLTDDRDAEPLAHLEAVSLRADTLTLLLRVGNGGTLTRVITPEHRVG